MNKLLTASAICLALSFPARAGNITVATDGLACPTVEGLRAIYSGDPDLNAVMIMVARFGCSTIQAGIQYPLVERGPVVTRIRVGGAVMFARAIDLGP